MKKSVKKETPEILNDMYGRLFTAFGPRGWWPARTKFEVCIGAILTQNTAWRNVKAAIANLRTEKLLTSAAIKDVDEAHLAQLIVPSGYYNQKAKKLKNFIRFLYDGYSGSLEKLFRLDVPAMREALLSVNGIGRETADSIILYAAKKPIFVIDAYTRRILSRHGLAEANADYDVLRSFFEDNLPADEPMFNEFHALIVHTGFMYCKKQPRCSECPLNGLH